MRVKTTRLLLASAVLQFMLALTPIEQANAGVTITGSAAPSPVQTVIIPDNVQGTSSGTIKAVLRNVSNAQLRFCVGPLGGTSPLFCGEVVTAATNPSVIVVDASLIFGGNALYIQNGTLNTGTFTVDLE